MNYAKFSLDDVQINVPLRIAVAERDQTIKRDREALKRTYESIVSFPGNHCFNKRGDRYLGMESDGKERNEDFFHDVLQFFNTYLDKSS